MKHIYTWFRGNLLSILSIIKVALAGIMLLLLINIQVNNARQASTTKQLVTATKHIADQINQSVTAENQNTNQQLGHVNAHLDCIVEFFSQSDRSQKAIADIDTCQLRATDTAQGVVVLQQSSSTGQASKTQQTASTQSRQQTSATSQPSQSTQSQQPQPGLLDRGVQDVVRFPRQVIRAMGGLL